MLFLRELSVSQYPNDIKFTQVLLTIKTASAPTDVLFQRNLTDEKTCHLG